MLTAGLHPSVRTTTWQAQADAHLTRLRNHACTPLSLYAFAQQLIHADQVALSQQFIYTLCQYEGKPSMLDVLYAYAFSYPRQFADAEAQYRHIIQQNMLFPDAQAYRKTHYNLACVLLTQGYLGAGFKLFEERLKQAEVRERLHAYQKPYLPLDVSVQHKTIAVIPEYGLGDSLQMLRFVKGLSAQGARVLVFVRPSIKRIAQGLLPQAEVFSSGDHAPAYDYIVGDMSLPLYVNIQHEQDLVPYSQQPYLQCPTDLLPQWQPRVFPKGASSTLQVGVVWNGSTHYGHDHLRSMPLHTLQPLTQLPIALHSLQIEYRHDEQALLGTYGINDYQPYIQDLADTAALIMQMDLIIAVDTSVAHLAGAMGKPVWLMLPYHADWRWFDQRTYSPWYPQHRLFRQTQPHQWHTVTHVLCSALNALLQTKNGV